MPYENKGAMAATIVVAASDSLNKAAANYVCDGVADDVEIQAAIDALPAGGGKVVLLEGTYDILTSILIGDDTILSGNGWATKLVVDVDDFPNNTAIITLNSCARSTVRDLYVDGLWGAGRVLLDHGVYILSATDCLVENVYVTRCKAQGFLTGGGGSTRCKISNCIASFCSDRGFNIGNVANDILLSNCLAIDCTLSGFLVGSPGISSYNIHIINCVTINATVANTSAAFYIQSGSIDCRLTNCSALLSGSAGFSSEGKNTTFVNCFAYKCAGNGIQLSSGSIAIGCKSFWNSIAGFSLTGGENKMIGCISERNYQYGIRIIAGSRNLVEGCSVLNNSQTGVGTYTGVLIETGSTYNIIKDNHCYDSQDSITSLLTDDAAAGQKIVDVADGSLFWPGQFVTISDLTPLTENNTIDTVVNNRLTMLNNLANTYTVAQTGRVTGRKTQSYPIREVDTSDYNNIVGNTVYGNISASIPVLGVNTLRRRNIGYLTENSGTATVLNATTSIAVAHGLAATPTRIQITPRENPTNAVSFWWVDTVGAANFTINVNADPGASNLDFDWHAQVREG